MDKETFRSWAGVHASKSWSFNPESIGELQNLFTLSNRNGVVPRGLGRSYGDQALNSGGGVVTIEKLSNTQEILISDDGSVSVPAGISYGDLLKTVLKNGWIIPVVPGSRFISIGGAIAADVHGKNHFQKNSLSAHILELEILIANGTVVTCNRSSEPELFWATIGGLGLTGVILRALIKLDQIQSTLFEVRSEKFSDFDQLLSSMEASAKTHSYSVAWLDLLTRNKPGRGILQSAELVSEQTPMLEYSTGRRLTIPRVSPINCINNASCRIFNEFKFRKHPPSTLFRQISIQDFLHPLDQIGGWNLLYGERGFFQWQVVVPEKEISLLKEIVATLGDLPMVPTLSVLKRLGSESLSYLSFCKPGWTLAVDFPFSGKFSRRFLDKFDAKIAAVGGRVYLAKDGGLDPKFLHEMYPKLRKWQEVKKQYDPNNTWQSNFSRRLLLT